MASKQNSGGYTLIELLVALSVAAILVTAAVPSFRKMLLDQRLASAANELLAAVQFARSEAVRGASTVQLSSYTGGDWAGGWTVWRDADGDGQRSDGEILHYWPALKGGEQLSADRDHYRFHADGLVDAAGEISLCHAEGPELGRAVSIAPTGRVDSHRRECAS